MEKELVEQLSVLNEGLHEINATLYLLIESVDKHTIELQRLRRILHEKQVGEGQQWLPLEGGEG